MRDLITAEWRKATTGRTWWILAGLGVLMSLTSGFGFASQGDAAITTGAASPSAVTDDVVRAWMMTFLFSSLFGALLVTREYASGSITRSVLLSGTRGRLFAAKLTVATLSGVLYGLLAAALAALCAYATLNHFGHSPEWTTETTLIALGVLACNVLAAAWGAFLGWIVRHQTATVVLLMALTLLVDPGVQQLAPDVAKFLLTIAMSSVYRDAKPDLLSVPVALLVIGGWLTAAGFAARKLLFTRDVT
ncbi:hypothetical protein AR457_18455 [Streptomyces agglomeratus]|uniref:ABC transporter permease n=1 Tax=Streptomyces agglomeratus TaxID=285458 RepID=A0A1E5P9X6_9ACTN|nr:ABC transporter permease [Streptomyces agglomeratus]OEJ26164.1 hypothetical protein AS594_18315 [Streptomyces agglomeratus]OEJ39796.1 hypothetical protein BGK70_18200 [Streptomyces agglomeratus]OEJ45824.1 hypothetical protein AR457_18455 [Streptomyces agglomeratus]OEJ52343.1 hypothetical protein BGK72_17790 [Streptomyces agglomeratus]OEJ59718.1 hypothetical protein BGM19_18730 [Streptomyces agglomeratus]